MKQFLPLLCFFYSCNQPVQDKKKQAVKPPQPSMQVLCEYQQRKEQAQLLHKTYQAKKTKPAESILTRFIVDSVLPCWYGTTWDFNGITETPGQGNIACGYFVTTVLRDAGIQLNRVKLSQCASEEMIQQLCGKKNISRFSNLPLEEFTRTVSAKEPGLYIIGLDFHTGFLYNDSRNLFFIHASYAAPKIVRKEMAVASGVLAASKYKVVGRVNLLL